MQKAWVSAFGMPTWLRRTVAAILLSSLALTGCYRTADLMTTAPEPDTRIVARLTPTGAEQMAPWIGADAIAIEARIVEVRGEEWELAMLRVDHDRAASVQWNGERVVFPQRALRDVQERELDSVRTGIFAVGIVTTLTTLAVIFIRSQFRGGDNGGGGGEPVH